MVLPTSPGTDIKVTPDKEVPIIPKATKYHGEDLFALKKSVNLDFLVVRFDINNSTKKYIIKIRSIILAFISIFEKKQLC